MAYFPRKLEIGDWERWFAWRPVKVHGSYTWLKTVYRRDTATYFDNNVFFRYRYGTVFDILKDDKV